MLLEEGEFARFDDLRLRLRVNGETRQDMLVGGDMVFKPLEALRALTKFQPMQPGDLLLTGTPIGTALSAPPKPIEIIASLLPPATKWRISSRSRPPTRNTSKTVTSSRLRSPPTTA